MLDEQPCICSRAVLRQNTPPHPSPPFVESVTPLLCGILPVTSQFSVSSFCVCTLCINCPISLVFLFKEQKVRTVSPPSGTVQRNTNDLGMIRGGGSHSAPAVCLSRTLQALYPVSSILLGKEKKKKAGLKCP